MSRNPHKKFSSGLLQSNATHHVFALTEDGQFFSSACKADRESEKIMSLLSLEQLRHEKGLFGATDDTAAAATFSLTLKPSVKI